MQELVRAIVLRRGITPRDFFRYAYIWRFKKDISFQSLDNDVKTFEETHNSPPYVCEYVAAYYATNRVEQLVDPKVAHEAASV